MKLLLTLLLLLGFTAHAAEIKLTADNTAVLRDAFNAISISKLKDELLKLDANLKTGYPINLVLYTPGGSVQSGLELYEFIKGMNRPVNTITLFAASMGFQTVQNLGKRYIVKYGVLMSHKARGGFRGEFGGGDSQLESRLNMWLRRINMLDATTVSRTNGKQTFEGYRASYDNELWLNGPEAVAQGYADELATVTCDSTLINNETKQSYDMGSFRINVTYSGCPIIVAPTQYRGELLTNKGYMSVEEFLANNGKFGKGCRDEDVTTYSETKQAQLCSHDKTLTLKKIQQKIAEKKEFINKPWDSDYILKINTWSL